MIYVVEVTKIPIAAIEAETREKAREVMRPAIRAKNRQLFKAGRTRWSEVAAMLYREATPDEAVKYSTRRPSSSSDIVWPFDVD